MTYGALNISEAFDWCSVPLLPTIGQCLSSTERSPLPLRLRGFHGIRKVCHPICFPSFCTRLADRSGPRAFKPTRRLQPSMKSTMLTSPRRPAASPSASSTQLRHAHAIAAHSRQLSEWTSRRLSSRYLLREHCCPSSASLPVNTNNAGTEHCTRRHTQHKTMAFPGLSHTQIQAHRSRQLVAAEDLAAAPSSFHGRISGEEQNPLPSTTHLSLQDCPFATPYSQPGLSPVLTLASQRTYAARRPTKQTTPFCVTLPAPNTVTQHVSTCCVGRAHVARCNPTHCKQVNRMT